MQIPYQRSKKILVLLLTMGILFAACSLFQKTSKTTTVIPPPKESKPITRPEPAEDKSIDKNAPFNVPAFKKEEKKPLYRIALFTPLYLDSLFDASLNYLKDNRQIPRYVLPGLEFYEGAQLALDTLAQQGYRLQVTVYDCKSRNYSIHNLSLHKQLDSVDLIIGAVSYPEIKDISEFAQQKNINFISATYPNDAGVRNNPFMAIVNSTLETHCEALHLYIQSKIDNKQIILFKKNNRTEEKIASHFMDAYKQMKYPKKVAIQEVNWRDDFTEDDLAKYLIPGKNNVCIFTTFDENTVKTALSKLAPLTSVYVLHIFGMPTWDGIKELNNEEYKTLNIYYSTSYYNEKQDPYSSYLNVSFRHFYKSRPSDMAFKGFELTYYFSQLLNKYGVYFNKNINDPGSHIFTSFDFRPVYLQPDARIPDYFENKNLYILRSFNGLRTRVN